MVNNKVMSKIKDPTPIPVTRTNKTSRLEIYLADDVITGVRAHRSTFTTQAGVPVLAPVLTAAIDLAANEVTVAIANKITDLIALVDAKDI